MESKSAVGSEEIPNVKEISALHNFNSGVLPDGGEGYECLSGFEKLHFFVRAIGTKVQVRVRLKIIFIAKIHFLPVIISGHCIY